MSELLSHLIERHQGLGPTIAPRRPSRFETAGKYFAPAVSQFHGEDPPSAEADTLFAGQAESPPRSPFPQSDQTPPDVAPVVATLKLADESSTHSLDTASNSAAANAVFNQSAKNDDSEKVPPGDGLRRQPGLPPVRLSPVPPGNDYPGQEAARTGPRSILAPGEIHQRLVPMIARSAERPSETPVPSTTGTTMSQVESHHPGFQAPSDAITVPSGDQWLMIRPQLLDRRQRIDNENPAATTVQSRDLPLAPAPAGPDPEAPGGKTPAILEPTPLAPAGEHAPGAGEHLLVPPDWMARIQGDLQRHWDASAQKAKAEPVINVTIGRVEVRAEATHAPPKQPAKEKTSPVLSLDEYLSQRKGRR